MTARQSIAALMEARGWWELENNTEDGGHLVYFRWIGGIREEVCVCFDPRGSVEAWTVWHNTRVLAPDQEKGRRGRLEQFIVTGGRSVTR